MLLIKCILIITLLLILVQDYKHRAVSWVLFPLLLLLSAALFISQTMVELYLIAVVSNLLMTTVLLLCLTLYIKIKLKVQLFSVIGLGDILFFGVLSFAFAPITYLVFLLFGLLFSLVLHWFLNKKEQQQSVPLAGYLSAFFSLIYVAHWTGFINGIYAF